LHQYYLQLPCQSGTSLTVCIINGNKIQCANVGDSHALIVTPTSYYWISESHRLQDNSGERTKLSQYVKYSTDEYGFPFGHPRLYPGGLACSRSVGDADCPHINCKPSISEAVIHPKDILIIASDGL
jgi:serine/threonine protein phosphatase PrpC